MDIYASCTNPYIDADGVGHACGQCPLCRKIKTLEWCVRCSHELISNPKAIYITLTYDYKHLNVETFTKKKSKYDLKGQLEPEEISLFLKRLRKKFNDRKIKYYLCGELGDIKQRPHYHAILWGLTINDVGVFEYKGKWRSKTLAEIWGKGYVDISIEPVTPYAIQYVVGYVSKKRLDRWTRNKYYTDVHRVPPFTKSSQGLGWDYAKKHIDNWSKTGSISYNGIQVPIPRYYIKKLYEINGIKIRYKTFNAENLKLPKEVNYTYKIVKNPHCKHVINLTEALNNIKQLNKEKWIEKYNVHEDDADNIYSKYTLADIKRTNNNLLEYNIVKDMSETQREKMYTNVYKKPKHSVKNSPLCDNEKRQYSKSLYNTAKKKELTLMNGLYGKRNKYEMSSNEPDINPSTLDLIIDNFVFP